MGNTPYREDRRILEVSKKIQKINSKHVKELNVFMVGLDGAGKSTILYKHLMGSTYSADSITISQTITYNVETIKTPKIHKKAQRRRSLPPLPPLAPLPPIPPRKHQSKASQKESERVFLNIYDYCGKISTRRLWTNYKDLKIEKLRKTGNRIDFFILVIDCTDFERLNDEKNDSVQLALKDLLNIKSYLKIPLCIFANKQDISNAITPSVLPYRLGIKQITVWNLIANVKYVHNLCLSWKLCAKILSYLANPNYYWNMTKRHWNIFGTETVSKYNKGIHDGMQWIYNEYDKQKQKRNNHRRNSFTQRFKTM